LTTLTLVQKEIKFGDGSTGNGQFATDGTNLWPVSLQVDTNGNVLGGNVSIYSLPAGANLIGVVNISSNVSQNAAFTANSPLISGGIYNSTPPTINSTCASSLQLDTQGRLIVNVVTSHDIKVTNIPTINLSSYSSGYVIGGQQNLNVFRTTAQPSGIITQIWVASKGGSTSTITVYLFDSPPSGSTVTDHAALALANTDLTKLVVPPFVLTPTVIGTGSTQSFGSAALAISCQSTEGTPNTYLYLVATVGSAQTYPTTSDLVFGLSLSQD